MKKFSLTAVIGLLAVGVSMADVSVLFHNTNPVNTNDNYAANQPGKILLDFTVDGSGNVSLDASCEPGITNATILAVVDGFDDPTAGMISYAGAFGTTFSMVVESLGDKLRVSDTGTYGGLGVRGVEAQLIDNFGIETVKARASITNATIDFKSVDWTSRGNAAVTMKVIAPQGTFTNLLDLDDGTWDLDAEDIYLNNGTGVNFANATSNGYALAGFSFDVIEQQLPVPGIKVDFNNNLTPATSDFTKPIEITLDFAVDGGGFVTLDASCVRTNAQTVAAVDAWDGPAGYTEYTNNVSFSITIRGVGDNDMRMGAYAGNGGLGYGGQNQWRVDKLSEKLRATLNSLSGTALKMKSVDFVNGQSGGYIRLDGSSGAVTNALDSGSPSILAGDFLANNGEEMTFGTANVDALGYTLRGFEFDLAPLYVEPPVPGINIVFSYPAGDALGSINPLTLDFAIDGSGVVSLDAATASTNATHIAAVDAWDSGNVGYITNSTLFGKTFSLVVDASLAGTNVFYPLNLRSDGGGVLGAGGQNGGRIDGQLASGGPVIERIIWTMSGDVTLDFTSVTWLNSHPVGGIEMRDADTTAIYAMALVGNDEMSLIGEGFSIGSAQKLTFSGLTNYVEGTGIGGFSFDISAAGPMRYADWAALYPGLGGMKDDDDLDGLENLYEFAIGGDPTNGAIAPAYIPTAGIMDNGGSDVLRYVYTRREPVPVDMQYSLNLVGNLIIADWADAGYSVVGEGGAAPGFKTVTNETSIVEAEKFIKLVVEQN